MKQMIIRSYSELMPHSFFSFEFKSYSKSKSLQKYIDAFHKNLKINILFDIKCAIEGGVPFHLRPHDVAGKRSIFICPEKIS